MRRFWFLSICLLFLSSCNEDNILESEISTEIIVPEFKEVLSEMDLFIGDLSDLVPISSAFIFEPNSVLFSDYSHKQRIVKLPRNSTITYTGNEDIANFPDNSVIAKTFFYFNNESNSSEGRRIIETRIMIRRNGVWDTGNYIWNPEQTEAFLNREATTHTINYITQFGQSRSISYRTPSNADCFTCHSNNGIMAPLGFKFPWLNYDNQLQQLINNGYVTGIDDVSRITSFPDYNDLNETLDNRARAYMAINCAHCHIAGGTCATESSLRLGYTTPLEFTEIEGHITSIRSRMEEYSPNFSMPLIGTTIVDIEGFELIDKYLSTLE